jgi:hypothetical protein
MVGVGIALPFRPWLRQRRQTFAPAIVRVRRDQAGYCIPWYLTLHFGVPDRTPGFVYCSPFFGPPNRRRRSVGDRGNVNRQSSSWGTGGRNGRRAETSIRARGRGRSAGARLIYYYRAAIGRIYLLTAYAENEQANLTKAQRNIMRALTARLDQEP